MDAPRLSLSEHAVLGLLAEGPSHGFALAKQLARGGDLGRVLTVRRPLVYRALDRLVYAGLAVPSQPERGLAGPQRVVHRITPAGRRSLGRWLDEPVGHIRDIRIAFLLKVALLRRAGQSPLPLIRAQRAVLQPTLAALDDLDPADHVELWRRHNAAAAAAFLDDLEARYRG